MSKYTPRLGASLLFAGAVLLGACHGEANRTDTTSLASDSTLNRDLALAGRDTTTQPQLQDVPATPPASASEPATRRPTHVTPRRPRGEARAPEPTRPSEPVSRTTPSGNVETRTAPGNSGGGAVGVIAAGATLNAQATSNICTNTNAIGDHVSATLENAVSGTNGAMIPAGATVHLTVTQLKGSENANDPVVMEFAVNSVSYGGHTYPIEGRVESADVTRIKNEPKNKDLQKVGIGAVAGAIAGRLLGHSTKGAVIGGAAGAAAGAAAAVATANYEGCVEAGHSIVVTLTGPATVKA